MSEFIVKIEMKEDEFFFGDTFKGTAFIDVAEGFEAKEISLDLIFCIEGKGDKHLKTLLHSVLDESKYLEEGKHSYDFEIELPLENEECYKTYSGKIFQTKWKIKVNIDPVKGEIEKKNQEENNEELIKVNKKKDRKNVVSCEKQIWRKVPKGLVIFLNIFMYIFFSLILLLLLMFTHWILVLASNVLLILLIFTINYLKGSRYKKSERLRALFSEYQLEDFESFTDKLAFKLRLKAEKSIEIKKLDVTLIIEELSQTKEGVIHRNKIFKELLEEEALKLLKMGQEEEFYFNYKLDKEYPETLKRKSGNLIIWYIEIKINDIIFETYTLIVE